MLNMEFHAAERVSIVMSNWEGKGGGGLASLAKAHAKRPHVTHSPITAAGEQESDFTGLDYMVTSENQQNMTREAQHKTTVVTALLPVTW